jgi:putative CocE/NonD family hydrolase
MADMPLPAAPPVVMEPKYKVRVERNLRIPVHDGTHLSADLIRPDANGKFPAIIEYMPYRKDDLSQALNDVHYYWAERGFVGVRLDVRGTGSSEGVNTDEYMPEEQQDGYDAVEWLAKQPWCNGKVGMFGSSYGGFTCIQVAMHRPPHLKAIVPLYATDDRYTDDCHYTPGGNMRMYYDVGTYGGAMVCRNAVPPLPELAGPKWAEVWKDRLEKNEPYLLKWMKQQVDGPYWRGASLRPGYDRIQCPVFLIAGWRDGYPNPMLRMYTHLKAPKKLLMGPWVHQRANFSVPGPRIDYQNEVVRFFAHWLRDENTGIMKEPPVTVYLQEYAKPERTLDITPGHWRNDADFPPEGTTERTFYLQEGGVLAEKPGQKSQRPQDEFEYLPTVGVSNLYWSGGGISYYLADDQRADEAYSLVYTTAPFTEAMRILGWPRVILHGSSTAKVATFVVKLADVAPDGSSALIVDGSLNGTRRRSLTDPQPMTPGEVYELDIPMWPTGWVLQPGHRLRLAISGADFSNLWPTPEPARLSIYRDAQHPSRLVLPIVPESKLAPPHFLPPPQMQMVLKVYNKIPAQQIVRDQITGTVALVNHRASSLVLQDNWGTIHQDDSFRCTASSKDPAQASVVGTHTCVIEREDGTIEVTAESSIRATATAFQIVINLNVTRNGRPFFHKEWVVTEPRRLL